MQTPADASGEQAESTLIEDQCSSAQMQAALFKRALWLPEACPLVAKRCACLNAQMSQFPAEPLRRPAGSVRIGQIALQHATFLQ